jgi:hypothetical protein
MSGEYKNGTQFGKIIEPYTCFDPKFNVYDKSGQLRYVIIADCCQCGFICRNSCGKCSEVLFQIHKPGKEVMDANNTDGHIKKLFSGTVQEIVSDADNFHMVFPVDATAEDKLLLIGNVLMIDYRFYEDGGNTNNQAYY